MSTATLTDVPMPPMGVSIESATVVRWLVAVGDAVEVDQPICEIATDKVDTEIASPAAGTLAEIVVAEGDEVAVGDPLGRLSSDGSVVAPADPAAGSAPASGGADPAPVAAAADAERDLVPADGDRATHWLAGADVDPAGAAGAVVRHPSRHGGPLASPVARRLAAARGIALDEVRGSGMRGRIRRDDVLAALAAREQRPAPVAPATTPPPSPATAGEQHDGIPRGYEDVPHRVVDTTRQRRMISEHMLRSRQTAAHMTTEAYVDMTAVAAARAEINAEQQQRGGPRISYLSFIARAAVATLRDFPELNATFLHERNVLWDEVNLGVAVDTPDGLIAPVVRGAEQLTVVAIAERIADLAARARDRTLTADDLRGGTFTISNPGSVGGVSAPAIINQPQVGILGTPAIVKRAWVVTLPDGSDAILPRPIMRLALTFDHRAIDGAGGTRFVVAVRDALESWSAGDYR